MDMFAVLGKHVRGNSILFLLYTLMRLFWCAVSPVPSGFVTSRRYLNSWPLSIMKLVGSLSSSVFKISYISVLMFHGVFLIEREKIIFLTMRQLTGLKNLHYDFFLMLTSTHCPAPPPFQYLSFL